MSLVRIKVVPYQNFYLLRSIKVKTDKKEVIKKIPVGTESELDVELDKPLTFSIDYFKAKLYVNENVRNILVYWDLPSGYFSANLKMMFKNCLKAVAVSDSEFENPQLIIQTKEIRQSKPLVSLNIIGILIAISLVYFSFAANNNEEWWINLAFLIGIASAIRLFFQVFSTQVYSNSAFSTIAVFSSISLFLAITGNLDFKFKVALIIIPMLLTLKAYVYYILNRKVEL